MSSTTTTFTFTSGPRHDDYCPDIHDELASLHAADMAEALESRHASDMDHTSDGPLCHGCGYEHGYQADDLNAVHEDDGSLVDLCPDCLIQHCWQQALDTLSE